MISVSKVVPLRTSPVRDIIDFLQSIEPNIESLSVALEVVDEDDTLSFVLVATDTEFQMESICAVEEYFASKRRGRVYEIMDFEEEGL